MAISWMADDGQNISCSSDAALYALIGRDTINDGTYRNYVIDGVGDELAVNYNSASLTVTLGTGEAVIRGRHISVTGSDTTLSLPASSSGQLGLRYDLSQPTSDVVKFMVIDYSTDQDINSNGTVSDLVLGSFETSASGVTSFVPTLHKYSHISKGNMYISEYLPTDDIGNIGDFWVTTGNPINLHVYVGWHWEQLI